MSEHPETEGHTRGLLRSLRVIATGQALAIAIRVVRAKLIALMLGPSGIGLFSILGNLHQLGNQVASLGIPTSGVREVVAARENSNELFQIQRVLAIALTAQGGLALIAIWVMREPLAAWLMEHGNHSTEIGLIGIAVFLFLLSMTQQTLLQGFRRIADMSRVMVLGTLIGSVSGLLAVAVWGMNGLIVLLIAEPLATLIVARSYAQKIAPQGSGWPAFTEFLRRWWPMVRLGLTFMLGGLATTATLLLLRSFITRELNLTAAGHFAAAWTISMMYVGFLLDAMGKDYYPRLSEVIGDRVVCNRLMNDQMLLAVALGGPILALMIGFAPWVTRLFYSTAFDEAATLIQWQMTGNIFKIAAWVLSFSIIAAGRGAIFLGLELLFNALLIGSVLLGFPLFGLEASGIGFLIAYVCYFLAVLLLVRYVGGFRWASGPFRLLVLHIATLTLLLVAARADPSLGALAAIPVFIATTLVGLRMILSQIGISGQNASRIARAYAAIGWPIKDKN